MSVVKCPKCGLSFNRIKVESVHLGNRYYHLSCCSEDDIYRSKIFDFLKELWGNYTYIKINNQINSFITKNDYTSKQIYEDLIYFHTIKKADNNVYKDTIGIVPFIHTEAQQYYKQIRARERNKLNLEKQVEQQVATESKIIIVTKKDKRKHMEFEIEEG